MFKEFISLEEIEKYYVKETNTYVFKEYGQYIDFVILNFNVNIKANIDAWDIYAYDIKACNIKAYDIFAWNIKARDITARDIKVWSIYADDINYYAVCLAHKNIKCKSIKGRKENAKHFVLDGKLEVKE